MQHRHVAIALACSLAAASVGAQTPQDTAAIRQVGIDYVQAWYDGDAERMERVLHPELAKRGATTAGGRTTISNMGALAMVQVTRTRAQSPQRADQRLLEVTVLAMHRDIALARVVSWDFVDLISVARAGDRWVIVNDLWQGRTP